MKEGSKICKDMADYVRRVVREELTANSHVDVKLIQEILRPAIREDAICHHNSNPSFDLGNGPAVKNNRG